LAAVPRTGTRVCEFLKEYRQRIILIAGIALVASLGVYFALVIPRPQTVRLANGTELSLVAITRGPTNVCFPGGTWDKLIYRVVPAKGIGVGSSKIVPVTPLVDDEHYVEDGRVAFPNKAVVWIRHRGGTNAPPLPVPEDKTFWDIRATIADETGEEWEMRPTMIPVPSVPNGPLQGISRWKFPAFPRRGRTLRFRMYGRNSADQWDTLAEFKMRNPTPGPYPVWKPMALPATRTNGDVEVSLVDVTSGTKAIHWMPKDQRPFTMARFKVKQNGEPTEAWRPDGMEATDATGNEGSFQIINYGATNGFIYYDAQCSSLSPSEVWRLRMRFIKERELAPDRMWVSPDLPVRNGVLLPAKLTTNLQSCDVTLECSTRNMIRSKLIPKPKDTRLRLVDIVENRGASLEHLGGSFGDYEFEGQWKIPPGAESIRITIGLVEMRHFEFLAQPVRQ